MVRKILALVLVLMLTMSCTVVMAEEASDGEWWNILLLGSDDRNMSQRAGRTDTMMILSVNQEEGRAKLTSIMRDTWVSIPGKNNNKINAANVFGGPELAVQTVNECFGTDIENYVLINMRDMIDIVDYFGGVDLELSSNEVRVANDYINQYKKETKKETQPYEDYSLIASEGVVHLNGMQAMAHCRDRYTDSDFGRVMRGQDTLLALATKAQEMELNEVLEIATSISQVVETNLTDEQIKSLATTILSIDTETVGQYRIPADGAYQSGTFSGTWMIKADLAENTELLHQFIYEE